MYLKINVFPTPLPKKLFANIKIFCFGSISYKKMKSKIKQKHKMLKQITKPTKTILPNAGKTFSQIIAFCRNASILANPRFFGGRLIHQRLLNPRQRRLKRDAAWEAMFKMLPFCFSLETTPRAAGKMFKSKNCALVFWQSRCQHLGTERGVTQKTSACSQTPREG